MLSVIVTTFAVQLNRSVTDEIRANAALAMHPHPNFVRFHGAFVDYDTGKWMEIF
jgi:hypothetical protein